MYLVVGDSKDPWCTDVYTRLKGSNQKVHIISNPLLYPTHFTWKLNSEHSVSKLQWNKKAPIYDNQIKGVFIRRAANIDGDGWEQDDYIYMQTEIQAALLGLDMELKLSYC